MTGVQTCALPICFPVTINGFIVSVQLPGVPPKQSFVDTSSSLAETVASILNSTPHAIILVQASVNL